MNLTALLCPACGAQVTDTAGIEPNSQVPCTHCGALLVLTDLVADEYLTCPRCRARNEPDGRYCAQCGAGLKVGCPFCYSSNPATAAHCRNCGANLRRAQARKQAWLEQERVARAERQVALAAVEAAEAEARRKASYEKLLQDLAEPENHPVVVRQLHALGAEAVPDLIALLQDADVDRRFGAAQTLGLIGAQEAIAALSVALRDVEPAVRFWAADALGRMQAATAVRAIAVLLDDRHAGVRKHAKTVLQQLGTVEANQVLAEHGSVRRLFKRK